MTKVYADGADIKEMLRVHNEGFVKGFTTNPTLMKKSGITDYEKFAKDVLREITKAPVSFEVFSDEFPEMKRQALKLSKMAENVYVKIPITNSVGESSIPLIAELTEMGVKLNVTAIMTVQQVREISNVLTSSTPTVISVFAGRIADTGIDPVALMKECVDILKGIDGTELLWASPREILNYYQAQEIGCDIITITPSLINKIKLKGKDLDEYSLETVQMFYNDACAVGYKL